MAAIIDVKILVLPVRKAIVINRMTNTAYLSHVMYRIFAVAQAGGVAPGGHS